MIPADQIDEVYNFKYALIATISGGLFGGLMGGSLLVFKLNKEYRERTFLYGILNVAVLFVMIYTGISILMTISFSLAVQSNDGNNLSLGSKILENTLDIFQNPAFWTSMAIWSLMVAGTQFMLQVSDKFGNGVLWRFLTGKYFHPREERRIFMFLDIKSSTSIAENIGHMKYFELLSQFYKDITDPIINCAGEIYQYVGDEVIVTWEEAEGISENNCIRCFYEIQRIIENNKDHYLANYGFVPGFKAGIHVGDATVGEIGILKKDIVFSGDVLNTTARIQGECNKYGVDILISAELLSILRNVDSEYKIEAKGVYSLKGKENVVGLISLEEQATSPELD
jgi:adenylate cyclase